MLACAEQSSVSAVAGELGISRTTVGKWRSRFVQARLEGLNDEPRPGRPRTISDERVEWVITATLEQAPPGGDTHWSTRSMARSAGMSQSAVSRIWRAFGLKPHVVQTWKLSADPQFIDKVRDVVGLYLAPPDESRMAAIWPDAQMAAMARPYWQWRAIIRGGNRHFAPTHIRDTFPGTPGGLCVPCWLNLGRQGYQDPLEVLRVDLAVTDDRGRAFLAKERIALADLVAAHREEFRQAMHDEAVLAALAGIGSPKARFSRGAGR